MSTLDSDPKEKFDSETQLPELTSDFQEGGLRGWLVVLGCFLITAVIVGLSLCWGVFQAYYSETILSDASSSTLSLVGSLPGGLMTILSVFTGKMADRFQYRPLIAIGCILWVVMLIGTAFSTKLWHFMLIQGTLQGIAAAFVFPLTSSLPSQFFKKNRAFATGIVLSGSSFGGAVASAMVRVMLSHLGLRKTMLIKAGIDAFTLTLGFVLIKERPNPDKAAIVWYDKKFLTSPVFWSIVTCMGLCNLGFPAPYFYLPTYAKQNVPNLTEIMAVLSVTMINVSSGVGRCCAGFMADRIGVTNAMFTVVLASGLIQLLVWNFVYTYPGIMALSVLYGFFAVCFWSLATPLGAFYFGTQNLATLTGLIFVFTGPGELAGPPITGAIYTATSSWHAVIAFSGTTQVVGAFCLLYARFKRQPKLWTAF